MNPLIHLFVLKPRTFVLPPILLQIHRPQLLKTSLSLPDVLVSDHVTF
jgi:hypothetical protein